MSEGKKPLSILLVDCGREVAEDFFTELGLTDWRADTCNNAHSAIEVLRGQKHYDLLLTIYEGTAPDETDLLRQVYRLDHRKKTLILVIARKSEMA